MMKRDKTALLLVPVVAGVLGLWAYFGLFKPYMLQQDREAAQYIQAYQGRGVDR